MLRFPRPCLTCRKLTRYGSRCEQHTRQQRSIYGGDWPVIARAWIDAHPVCVECGETRRELLTADHIEPGSLRKGIQTLCRSCNTKKRHHAS